MSLLQVFLASLGSFALLQFAFIPWSKYRLEMDRSPTSIGRSAMLATLGYLRGVLLIVAATSAALLLILAVLRLKGGATIAQLQAAVLMLQSWRERLTGFGTVWGGITLVSLVLALGIHAHRSGKRRVQKIFQKIRDAEWARLRREREEGRLEELPSTKEMVATVKKIEQLKIQRETLLRFNEQPKGCIELIDEITQSIATLNAYLEALDIERRIRLELHPEQSVIPEPRTRWEWFQSLLMSKGLLAGLNAGTRLLYMAALALLVPCLLGVCDGRTQQDLNQRIAQLEQQQINLEDLQVSATFEAAKQTYEQARQNFSPQEQELGDEDEENIKQVVVHFENAMASRFWGGSVIPQVPASEFRSMLARDRVLNAYSQRTGQQIKPLAAMSKASELRGVERETVAVFETAAQNGPTTRIGKQLQADLRAAALRSPSVADRIRTGLKNFASPASGNELGKALFNRITSVVVDGDEGHLGELVRRTLNAPELKKAMARYQEGTFKQFYADFVSGESDLAGAINRVSSTGGSSFMRRTVASQLKDNMRAVFDHETARQMFVKNAASDVAPTETLMDKLRSHPPGIDEETSALADLKKTNAIFEHIEHRGQVAGATRSSRALTRPLWGYTDQFPAQLGVEAKTAFGKITSSMPVSDASQAIKQSQLRFQMSRNYGILQGFSRVGGVLIGRGPNRAGDSKCDFVDLKWEAEGPSLRLILVGRDGTVLRSRPHRTSLISQALAYAADGRPVAVTIINATPLYDQKVLLHPVFIDTPLGVRVIALDKFVFDYTEHEEFHRKARNDVDAQMALFTYAWAIRIGVIRENIEKLLLVLRPLPAEDLQHLRLVDSIARAHLDDRELALKASEALKNPQSMGDPALSPLTVKTEFFDQELVRAISVSTRDTSGSDISDFRKRLHDRLTTATQALAENRADYRENERWDRFQRWIEQLPSFQVMSGVRERAFDANPSELVVPDGAEIPMHFDFMLQIAFTSKTLRDSEAEHRNADDTPWEYPSIKKATHNLTMDRIRANASDKDRIIVTDVSEFTLLQRLFRMAFSGDLGRDFPVEKLCDLTQVSTAAAPRSTSRTLRWYTRPGKLEEHLLGQLEGFVAMLKSPEISSVQNVNWIRDMFQLLEARRMRLKERIEKWSEFQKRLSQTRSQLGVPERLWNEWEAWDISWQSNWASHKDLDAILTQAHRALQTQATTPSNGNGDTSTLEYIAWALEIELAQVEMRSALGVSRDDREADFQRGAPLPSLE
jgi:hypothetical protein